MILEDPTENGAYIESLCEARKSKGLLPEDAKEILLSNPLFFGATMVRVGDADGMVAGAINSSANVLRAALQVVKTAPGTEIVSAFMLMDTQAKGIRQIGKVDDVSGIEQVIDAFWKPLPAVLI